MFTSKDLLNPLVPSKCLTIFSVNHVWLSIISWPIFFCKNAQENRLPGVPFIIHNKKLKRTIHVISVTPLTDVHYRCVEVKRSESRKVNLENLPIT